MEFDTKTIVKQERFSELVRKETQLEFVRKWLESKTTYNNYADVSDLLLLLDVKKEQGSTNEQ